MSNQGIELFNRKLIDTFAKNKKYLFQRNSYLPVITKITKSFRQQAKTRKRLETEAALIVPPLLIMSVTNDCNLSCKGCYACDQNRDKNDEMDIETIERVIDDAVELGVAVIMIAGGEPLMKDGILEIPMKHDRTLFPLFTNGLLFEEDIIDQIKKHKNIVLIISIEGKKDRTDARRGIGVFDRIVTLMDRLNQEQILFGTSVTLTSENYRDIIDSGYLDTLEKMGSRAAFLIEYVPSDSMEDEYLCLTEEQKSDLRIIEDELTEKYNMMIVPLPGNEELYGGCLAAGRGFLHISSTGSVEACPFAPYSDLNVKKVSLRKALKSKMLQEIRDNHHLLKESKGGCALKENKAWIKALHASDNKETHHQNAF